jgi:hypothetical protein
MITVEIPIRDKKNPPALKFPERCVNCGQPKHVVLPLKLSMGVQKRGGDVLMDLPVPVCAACEHKEHRISYVTLLPFTVVGLLVCGIVFVPVWLLVPEGPTLQTAEFNIVVGAFAGMVAGLGGGTAVEFVLKLLVAPVYGRLLLNRPLSIVSLFNDSENVVGLSAKFTDQKKSLKLTFENDEIGREFEGLNL